MNLENFNIEKFNETLTIINNDKLTLFEINNHIKSYTDFNYFL
jgi:hypothetical protein